LRSLTEKRGVNWLLAGIVVLASLSPAVAQTSMPAEVTGLLGATPKVYLTKFANLPRSVIDALESVTIGRREPMADAGEPWNPSDVVTRPVLSRQRLIWAVSVNGYVIVHYEQGGYAHSFEVVVISPAHDDGTRAVIWPTAVSNKVLDFPTFAALVRVGKVYTYNPRSR
jgi:hypothetical protein